MIFLTIWLSIGFGVWLGLIVYRLKAGDSLKGIPFKSFLYGFVGGLVFWPVSILFIEPQAPERVYLNDRDSIIKDVLEVVRNHKPMERYCLDEQESRYYQGKEDAYENITDDIIDMLSK